MRSIVITNKDVLSSNRFDGSYHNAAVNIYDGIIRKHSSHNLSFYCSDVFTSGRNRRVYTSEAFGVPFLSNSDVMSANPFMSCKYTSRKYGFDVEGMLKKGMILTGRVGAIGQTAFVTESWEKVKAIGSDNIIRIQVKPEYKNGFIYAYLASKVGNLSFWKHATGGVQPFITDSMVGTLPIPDFPEEFQEKIDSLIAESARLRDISTESLNEAHALIESHFTEQMCQPSYGIVSSKTVSESQFLRFEATYHLSVGKQYDEYIKNHFEWKSLGELSESISRPGIAKRMYVKDGITFLGGTDIFLSVPESDKKLSRKAPSLEDYLIQEGWILLPRSGTIGDVVFTNEQHAQKLVSEDVVRIIPNNILRRGFVFSFLSSKIGKALIQRPIFGSVIQHVEPPLLSVVPIPVFEEAEMEKIASLAEKHRECWGKAAKMELEAISLVEKEIEKWNN